METFGLRQLAPRARVLRCVGTTAVIAALGACADMPGTADASRKFLGEAELLATLPGNTVTGLTRDGTPWTQTYSAADGTGTGTVTGSFGDDGIDATWSVDGSQWCEDWGTGSACFTFERVGESTLRAYQDGEPRANLWTVL
jgi:hypothetical protein